MKIIIAGSRDFDDYALLRKTMDSLRPKNVNVFKTFDDVTVISGGASGADTLGERWARARELNVIRIPAKWHKYGKAAGPIRNEQMVKMADMLVAFWDTNSPGTFNIIETAKKYGVETRIIFFERKNNGEGD